MSLPSSVNYGEPLTTLPPETQNYSVAMTALNGSKFDPSSQILVDLGNRGFLDPASLSIRYRITYTLATTTDVIKLVATPCFSPVLRLDTICSSQTIETINNYNVVANMLCNLGMSVSDKMGQQYLLGYTNDTDNQNTDGCIYTTITPAVTVVRQYSAPLVASLLGSAEKLIPLFLLNNIRLAFTLDTLANIQTAIAADVKVTAYQIDNFEVVYNMIDFGREVERQIIMENPKLRIKSSSFATSIAPQLASASSASQTLSFNLRYASVKSAFLNFGGADATKSANRNMDSYDDDVQPAKFWIGVNLQKLTVSEKAWFTGISTQMSPIYVNLNIATATTQAFNPMLILCYDSIIEVDSQTKQIMMIQ